MDTVHFIILYAIIFLDFDTKVKSCCVVRTTRVALASTSICTTLVFAN